MPDARGLPALAPGLRVLATVSSALTWPPGRRAAVQQDVPQADQRAKAVADEPVRAAPAVAVAAALVDGMAMLGGAAGIRGPGGRGAGGREGGGNGVPGATVDFDSGGSG